MQPNFVYREEVGDDSANVNNGCLPFGLKLELKTPAAPKNKVYFYYFASSSQVTLTDRASMMKGDIIYSLGGIQQLKQPWVFYAKGVNQTYSAFGKNSLPVPNVVGANVNPVQDCLGIAIGAAALTPGSDGTSILTNPGALIVDNTSAVVEAPTSLIYPFYADFDFDLVQISITANLNVHQYRLFLAVTSFR
jgi:hypothetical protein